MSLRFLRAIWSDVRGTAIIEGAIALPVLFLLFFGVFEFSWLYYEQHRVSTGIRDAARYIARSNLTWTTIDTAPTIPGAVKTSAQNLATTGDTSQVCSSPGTGATCRVPGWLTSDINTGTDITVSSEPCTCECGWGTMWFVEVKTSFTPKSLGFLDFLKVGPFTLNVDHYERLMAPCTTGIF